MSMMMPSGMAPMSMRPTPMAAKIRLNICANTTFFLVREVQILQFLYLHRELDGFGHLVAAHAELRGDDFIDIGC